MINQYGADAVRWFILSDSPPEKDVQWSDSGVASSNKFLQKIWNLNSIILNRKQTKSNKKNEENFNLNIDTYIFKIDKLIDNFQMNVAIAQFYEVYKYLQESLKLEIDNKIFSEGFIKIIKLMIPFTPHLAFECLSLFNCKSGNTWPKVNNKIFENAKINMVIQVNGKTRDVITVKKRCE